MKLPSWLRPSAASEIAEIDRRRAEFASWSDEKLRAKFRESDDLADTVAVVAVVAARVLHLEMFDVQLQGALALARGKIVEMQTGEGKTLACTPAVAWYARSGGGVHVMTVNDYLARRDAAWMGGIYSALGLSVGCIQQTMRPPNDAPHTAAISPTPPPTRVGFDFLRDQIALRPDDQVHRPFQAAVIDEADSILIDEARIPLVLAGGADGRRGAGAARRPDRAPLPRGVHFTLDEYGRNIALADEGIRVLERALRLRQYLRRIEPGALQRRAQRHPRALPAAPRRGLRGEERRHRIGGPVQGPHRAGSPLARRTAHRHRSQGGRAVPPPGPRAGLHHAAEPGGALSAGLRHDRNRRHPGRRVPPMLWARGGGDSDQPAGDSRG